MIYLQKSDYRAALSKTKSTYYTNSGGDRTWLQLSGKHNLASAIVIPIYIQQRGERTYFCVGNGPEAAQERAPLRDAYTCVRVFDDRTSTAAATLI